MAAMNTIRPVYASQDDSDLSGRDQGKDYMAVNWTGNEGFDVAFSCLMWILALLRYSLIY